MAVKCSQCGATSYMGEPCKCPDEIAAYILENYDAKDLSQELDKIRQQAERTGYERGVRRMNFSNLMYYVTQTHTSWRWKVRIIGRWLFGAAGIVVGLTLGFSVGFMERSLLTRETDETPNNPSPINPCSM